MQNWQNLFVNIKKIFDLANFICYTKTANMKILVYFL